MHSRVTARDVALVVAAMATGCGAEPASSPASSTDGQSEAPLEPAATGQQDEPAAVDRRPDGSAAGSGSESGSVTASALPPAHLDEARFPEALVPRDQIVSGGPPPDGIPALDDPATMPVDRVDWLAEQEPVLLLEVGDEARIYPVQVMTWHEIANDVVDGVPVAVTYCPLCNTAIAFDRRHGEVVLDFGTSGALYQSAMVMYDRQTESLWTHFDGQAVVGTFVGAELRRLPVATVSWAQARATAPDAEVVSRETGFDRPYGTNPYTGYDDRDGPLAGFFSGDVDARAAAMARVVGIGEDEDALAVRTDHLAQRGVVDAELDGQPVTIWHLAGTASSLDAREIAEGDDVGTTGAFVPVVDGRTLSFARAGGRFTDAETQSTWNILGTATDGPLAGAQLERVASVDTFWFAWSTYRPGSRLLGA